MAGQRDEMARLKGLKGRPVIRPSGMEDATEPKRRGRRGRVTPRVVVKTQVICADAPAGSQFFDSACPVLRASWPYTRSLPASPSARA